MIIIRKREREEEESNTVLGVYIIRWRGKGRGLKKGVRSLFLMPFLYIVPHTHS